MVHRNVYDAPAVPEKFGVALFASLILPPDPLIIVHVPVPIEGVFPERVTVVNPQVTELVISVPAFAGVGASFTAINSALLVSPSQTLFVTTAR